jgi:hypothetical protein
MMETNTCHVNHIAEDTVLRSCGEEKLLRGFHVFDQLIWLYPLAHTQGTNSMPMCLLDTSESLFCGYVRISSVIIPTLELSLTLGLHSIGITVNGVKRSCCISGEVWFLIITRRTDVSPKH